MKLSSTDIFFLTNCAISSAYQAGHLIQRSTTKAIEVISKTGGDSIASQVVTEIDIKAQELILQTLLPTCELFDLALLTEESEDTLSRLDKEYFWCVDPLDGTLPFIEKRAGYSVSIALVSKSGEPIIGVVFDPVTGTLYHAIKNGGAFRNSQPWIIEKAQTNSLTLVCDRSFLDQKNYEKIRAELNKISQQYGTHEINVVSQGGAAMNACWVLENAPACYFKFPKKQNGGGSIWDYAATSLIFEEIGAAVSDIEGNSLQLNRDDTTFMNHSGINFCSDSTLHSAIKDIYINTRG